MDVEWLNSFLRANGMTPPSLAGQVWLTVAASTSIMLLGLAAGLTLASLWPARHAANLGTFVGFVVAAVPPLILAPLVLIITGPSRWAVWWVMIGYNIVAGYGVGQNSALALPPAAESVWKRWGNGGFPVAASVRLPWMLWYGSSALRAVAGYSYGVWLMMEYLAVPGGIGRIMRLAVSYNNFTLLGYLLVVAIGVGALQDSLLRWGLRRLATLVSRASGWLRHPACAFSRIPSP